MRFFPNNNIADSLFFSSHKRKNGSLRQTLHPFKQTTGKESISRFPPTCAASARNPKLALDFVLDDARVFLCGDLAVVRPCSAGRRSPRVRHLGDIRMEENAEGVRCDVLTLTFGMLVHRLFCEILEGFFPLNFRSRA